MRSYSVFFHVSPIELRFVGESPADGGITQNDEGVWHDVRGNSVSRITATKIDERDGDLLRQAYCGEELPDRSGFLTWMANQGIPAQVAKNVADAECG
jgi:hypothetical protein